MFRPLEGAAPPVGNFEFEGRAIPFRAGQSVAAALLEAGVDAYREHAVDGVLRAPYCMMGVCFECLIEIDGVPNRQGCLVAAAAGLRISRQSGARALR